MVLLVHLKIEAETERERERESNGVWARLLKQCVGTREVEISDVAVRVERWRFKIWLILVWPMWLCRCLDSRDSCGPYPNLWPTELTILLSSPVSIWGPLPNFKGKLMETDRRIFLFNYCIFVFISIFDFGETKLET